MTKAFAFGTGSSAELATVHPQLQAMARRALELSSIDFRVLQGIRTAAEQLAAFKSGHSKIKSGGRHQFGCAIDVIAINPKTGKEAWKPISLYTQIRGAFQKASKELGVPLRTLESIGDYGHFELPKSYMPDMWASVKN